MARPQREGVGAARGRPRCPCGPVVTPARVPPVAAVFGAALGRSVEIGDAEVLGAAEGRRIPERGPWTPRAAGPAVWSAAAGAHECGGLLRGLRGSASGVG